jgi:cell division protein FtsB
LVLFLLNGEKMRRLNVILLALLLPLSTLSLAQEALENTQEASNVQKESAVANM